MTVGGSQFVGDTTAEPPASSSNNRLYDEPQADTPSINGGVLKPLALLQKMFSKTVSIKKGMMLTQTPDGQFVLGGEKLKTANVNGRIIASLRDTPPTIHSPPTSPPSPDTGEPFDKIARLDLDESSDGWNEPLRRFEPTPMDVDDANTEPTDRSYSPMFLYNRSPRKATNLLARSQTPNLDATLNMDTMPNTDTTPDDDENICNTTPPTSDGNRTKINEALNVDEALNENEALNVNTTNNSTGRNVNILPRNINLELDHATKLQAYNDWLNCIKRDSFSGNMPIHLAALRGDVVALKRQCYLLIGRMVSLDEKNYSSKTALHLAILANQPAAVRILLKFGARPEVSDQTCNNAIHLAVTCSQVLCLYTLIAFNKDSALLQINVCNSSGFSPLHMCCILDKPEHAKLLLENKANPNLQDLHSGRTALFLAIEMVRVKLVKVLLEAKAKPMVPNYAGHTPLLLMTETTDENLEIRRMFEEAVAKEKDEAVTRVRARRRKGNPTSSRSFQRENYPLPSAQTVVSDERMEPVRNVDPIQPVHNVDDNQIIKPVHNDVANQMLRNVHDVASQVIQQVHNVGSNQVIQQVQSNETIQPVHYVANQIIKPVRNVWGNNESVQPELLFNNQVLEPVERLVIKPFYTYHRGKKNINIVDLPKCSVPNVEMSALMEKDKVTISKYTIGANSVSQTPKTGPNLPLVVPQGYNYKVMNLNVVRNDKSSLSTSFVTGVRKDKPLPLPVKPMIFSTVSVLRKESSVSPAAPQNRRPVFKKPTRTRDDADSQAELRKRKAP